MKTKFIDYVNVLRGAFISKCESENMDFDEETFGAVIDMYSRKLEEEIINNMCKIYDHLNEAFDNFIKTIRINKTTYDLHIIFNRKPTNDEVSRFLACIHYLEYEFKTVYKALFFEEEVFKVIEITIKEEEPQKEEKKEEEKKEEETEKEKYPLNFVI